MTIQSFDPGPDGAFARACVSCLGDGSGLRIHEADYATLPMGPFTWMKPYDALVIEKCVCYGRVVGASVFDTMFTAGRILQSWQHDAGNAYLIPNPDWRACLCGFRQAKAKDVRARLIELFPGGIGTPMAPGPLFAIRGKTGEHVADAIGLAVAFLRWKQETGKDVEMYRYPETPHE